MNKRYLLVAAGLTTIGALVGFGMKALADGIPSPNPLYYSGTLTEGGKLVDGARAVTINLWADATTAGTPLCQTVASTTNVVSGRFRIALASTCKTAINQNSNAYVEVIDGATSLGRTPVGAVPYAVEADHAVNATNSVNAADAGHASTADNATNATNATTAATANAAGGALATSLGSLTSTQSNLFWALNHAAADGACAALSPVTPSANYGFAVPKLYADTCTAVCAKSTAGSQTCRGDLAIGITNLSQASSEASVGVQYNYGCNNSSGSAGSEIGATSQAVSRYCCCSGP